ncbi:hypothetical protein BKA80DRAFT_313766 [Phyllosticta citrichinensis]
MPSIRHLFLLAAALSTAAHAAGTITVINHCSSTLTLDAGSASTLATGATAAPITYGADALELRVYTDDAAKPLILEATAAGGMVYYDVASLDGNDVGSYTVASSNGDCAPIKCASQSASCTTPYRTSGDSTTHSCADGSSLTWTLCG